LLSLRSGADEELLATPGITPPILMAGGREPERAPPSPPARAAPKPPARVRHNARPAVAEVKPAAAEKQTVEILRGDVFERRDFEKESRQ
jgi:pilus assembly protein CpaB